MSITGTPSSYNNLNTGRLSAKITTSTSTGVTVTADVFKTPAGLSAATWETGNQIWKISRKTRTNTEVEYVGVESLSQTGSAITTGTVIRYLPSNGSSLTSQGAGLSFPAGSIVEVVWTAFHAEQTMFKNNVNTITGDGAIRGSSTTVPILRLNNVTTAQRTAMTPANGDAVYDTDLGQAYDYIGGAWAARAAGTNSDGSATVAGKFEEATVAEQGSATATGGTGARLVPAVANLVKTSSGAGDENKLVILSGSGIFNSGFLGTGTPSSSTFLRGDSAWVVTPDSYFGTGADGALNVTSGTTTLDFNNLSILIKNYSSINISAGATLAVSNVPAAGGLLVLLCQGNVTIAGTINLSGKGSTGGVAVTANLSGVSNGASAGNSGTAPFNALGQTRVGGAGNGTRSNGSNEAAASGGGGGANVSSAGTVSGSATAGGSVADASTANSAITTAILALVASARGIIVGPGAGGGSGGYAYEIDNYTSGSVAESSGVGGIGGGGLYIACGGNYTDAGGTINLSATNGANYIETGSISITNYAIALGGGGGGAGGTGVAVVRGTITSSGTYTVTAGTGGTGVAFTNGGHTGTKTDGGAGATGMYLVIPAA